MENVIQALEVSYAVLLKESKDETKLYKGETKDNIYSYFIRNCLKETEVLDFQNSRNFSRRFCVNQKS